MLEMWPNPVGRGFSISLFPSPQKDYKLPGLAGQLGTFVEVCAESGVALFFLGNPQPTHSFIHTYIHT